jgi:acyl carrier protein
VDSNADFVSHLFEGELERRNSLHNTKARIREFVITNFLFGNSNGIRDDTSFLGEGIIDSTGVLELVTFIEETFDIKIEDEELIPENLDSIDNLVVFLRKKGIEALRAA